MTYINNIFFIPLAIAFTLWGCSDNTFESLGLRPNSTLQLVAKDGSVPATIVFEDPPISTTEIPDPNDVTGVTFTADIDISQGASPAAFEAIQGAEQIRLELVFIDTEGNERVFTVNPIQKDQPLTKRVFRQAIPFSLKDIAKIVLKVDEKEVAFAPPINV